MKEVDTPRGRRRTPAIFRGVRTESIDEEDLASAQNTFNELAIYASIVRRARSWMNKHGRQASRVLDLCSAQGLCVAKIADELEVKEATLLDRSYSALAVAPPMKNVNIWRRICADAKACPLQGEFDLILANSAYHHVEDHAKPLLLSSAATLMGTDSCLLIGDHFLPPYSSRRSFENAVVAFYQSLIDELKARSEDIHAIEIIRQAAYLCWLGSTEFKVSWPVFVSDVEQAGLRIVSTEVVWAPSIAEEHAGLVGSAVVTLAKN